MQLYTRVIGLTHRALLFSAHRALVQIPLPRASSVQRAQRAARPKFNHPPIANSIALSHRQRQRPLRSYFSSRAQVYTHFVSHDFRATVCGSRHAASASRNAIICFRYYLPVRCQKQFKLLFCGTPGRPHGNSQTCKLHIAPGCIVSNNRCQTRLRGCRPLTENKSTR